MAANFILPGSGTFSNFFVNVGAHAAVGAAQGAVVGGITSIIGGGNFGDGARLGAITGGIMGALQGIGSSEQFGNWSARRGFVSNADAAKQKFNFKEWDAKNYYVKGFNDADISDAVMANDPLNVKGGFNAIDGANQIKDYASNVMDSIKNEYRINEGAFLALAPEIKGAEYLLKADAWFARGVGVLNNNPYVRLGWGWNNVTKSEVFRLSIGNKNFKIYGEGFHYHKDFFTKQ